MLRRQVEFGIAQVQHVQSAVRQQGHLPSHLGRLAQTMGAPFGQRVGAVAARPRTTAFGLDADLPAAHKIRRVVDRIPFGGDLQRLRPRGRIDPQRAVLPIDQAGNAIPTSPAASFLQQGHRCVFAVTPDAKVGTGASDERLGKDRIPHAAQDKRRVGVPAHGAMSRCSTGTNDSPLGQKQSSALRNVSPTRSGWQRRK